MINCIKQTTNHGELNYSLGDGKEEASNIKRCTKGNPLSSTLSQISSVDHRWRWLINSQLPPLECSGHLTSFLLDIRGSRRLSSDFSIFRHWNHPRLPNTTTCFFLLQSLQPGEIATGLSPEELS